jgi:5'-deoxynucleotidase YfbR-like HD superfamily hydrolase
MSEIRLLDPEFKPTQYQRIQTLYRSGRVKRMHAIPTLNHHTDAQHVYGSLILGVHFCETLGSAAVNMLSVMLALLYHDAAELVTGDIPAPVKRYSESVRNAVTLLEARFDEKFLIYTHLTPLEQRVVKASDALDLAFNCLHEREMGNRTKHLESVFKNALTYATETGLPGVSYFTQALTESFDDV